MKKGTKKGESLHDKWSTLVAKVTDFPQKLADAIEEGTQEALAETSNLSCLKKGVLNFDLVEDDVMQIHQRLRNQGNQVLGSRLILDDQSNLMEIQTYTKKGGRNYRTVNSVKVEKLENFPDEILDELEEKKRVEWSFDT